MIEEQTIKEKEYIIHPKKFLGVLESRRLSPTTITYYKQYFKIFRMHTQTITETSINTFLGAHANSTGSRAFIKLLLHSHKVDIELERQTGRKPERQLHFATKQDTEAISSYLPNPYDIIPGIMFEAGLRISEVLAIKKTSIDFDKGIVGGIGKGNKEFSQPVSKRTLVRLKQICSETEGDKLFNITRQRAWQLIKQASNKLGKNIHPHLFRHGTGTYMREQGFDLAEIQEYLRHSNLNTTRIYTHVDLAKLKNRMREAIE